jgi:hypothetical protein
MKVATFGCSWTHGVGSVDDHYSWSQSISKHYEIDNYAVGGSSLSFQVYCFNEVLKHNNYDKIVFQFTTPGRLTYFPHEYNVFDHHERYTKNYRMFNMDHGFYRTLNCITRGHSSLPKKDSFWTSKEKYNLMKAYYSTVPWEIYRTEYKALVEYIAPRVDLCFLHNEDTMGFKKYPVMHDEVRNTGGQELLDSFIADDGDHYNKQGCDWVADWVLERI